MFPTMRFWGAPKQSACASNRRTSSLRFEPLETRQLLAVLTPNPIVLAGMVGNDLYITAGAPEVSVKINEQGGPGGTITVQGLTQTYLGTNGNDDTVQTDINNSYQDFAYFSDPNLRDLKVQLSGDDSVLQIGDPSDPVFVGRDLIVSMPASTTPANLTKAGVAATSYLNLDVDSVTVPRNMTITIGQNTTCEAAVIDITNDTVGSTTQPGNLTLKTYGDVPNMIGISTTATTGNLSLTTANGNDFVSVIGASVTSRLTISIGDGDNTVLLTDDFTENVDSSLQTFVASNPIFGDGLGNGALTADCVQTLADDLNAASTITDYSVEAQDVDIYSVGMGDDLVDVHGAFITGGNLDISTSGTGADVVAVTGTTVLTSTSSSLVGNVTITGGSGGELVYIDGLTVSGALTVNPGSGNDLVIADPDVSGAADAAITDFAANHPGVFFDPTNPSSPGLDIDDLINEILDLTAPSSFDVTKATFTTEDTASGAGSIIDISLANVASSLSVTMGNAPGDYLDINQTKVGTTATVTQGNGAGDTVVICGLGGRAAGDITTGPPTAEMTQFTLTVGNGTADTVVVSLDYQGDPGYPYGPAYGIAAADAAYVADNPSVANTVGAIDADLDFAAEAMLNNTANPSSVYADRVSIKTGNGGDLLTLSDILISASLTNRLTVTLGTGDNYLYFYDNTWDGDANLSGGGNGNTTLDEDRGGNTDDNMTIVGFPNVVPVFFD